MGQSFNIPNGQKFNIDGQMVDAFATKVTEVPETVVSQEKKLTGTMPPPPPPADLPILVVLIRQPSSSLFSGSAGTARRLKGQPSL